MREQRDHYKQSCFPKQTVSLVYVEQQLGQANCSSSAEVLQNANNRNIMSVKQFGHTISPIDREIRYMEEKYNKVRKGSGKHSRRVRMLRIT